MNTNISVRKCAIDKYRRILGRYSVHAEDARLMLALHVGFQRGVGLGPISGSATKAERLSGIFSEQKISNDEDATKAGHNVGQNGEVLSSPPKQTYVFNFQIFNLLIILILLFSDFFEASPPKSLVRICKNILRVHSKQFPIAVYCLQWYAVCLQYSANVVLRTASRLYK